MTIRVAVALPGAEPPAAAARSADAARLAAALFDGELARRGGARPGRGRDRGPGDRRAARRDAGRAAGLARPLGRRRRGDGALSRLDPVTLQVMLGALRAACDEMGAVLVRSAHSANIKERRDASTALFDARGQMVMQAEHIPVHLGAMPSAVAAVLDERHDAGRRLDPQRPLPRRHAPAGHHRDLARSSASGELLGFAASRAHHADVGGREPGSMPADSRTLEDEGVVISPTRLDERTRCASCAAPDAQPAPARGRPARPAGRQPRRAPSASGALVERFGLDTLASRRWRRRSTTPSGARARGIAELRGRRARGDATCSRRAEGDLELRLRATRRGRRDRRSTSRARPTSTTATSTARWP